MRGILIGAPLAAIATFIWGFVFWGAGIADPFAHMTTAQEAAVMAALGDNVPATGDYFFPDYTIHEPAELATLTASGPVGILRISKGSFDMMSPSIFIFGFLHMLAVAAALAVATRLAGLGTYAARFRLILLVAAAWAVWAHLGTPVWFHVGWAYPVWTFVYDLGAGALMAAVLAYFVKTRPA